MLVFLDLEDEWREADRILKDHPDFKSDRDGFLGKLSVVVGKKRVLREIGQPLRDVKLALLLYGKMFKESRE